MILHEARTILVCRGDELMIPDRIGNGPGFAPVNQNPPSVAGHFSGTNHDFVVAVTPGTWNGPDVTITGQFMLNGSPTGITSAPHTFTGLSLNDVVTWQETAVNDFGEVAVTSNSTTFLYAVWDSSTGSAVLTGNAVGNPFGFSRASAAVQWNASAKAESVASGALRISRDPGTALNPGWLFESQRTNKCSNFNANPTATTGMTTGTTAGVAPTLSLVTDVTELATAGLDLICTNGNVYKLDNTLGVNSGYVLIPGSSGNVNSHYGSAWIRGGAGRIGNEAGLVVTGSVAFSASAHYVRIMSSAMTSGSTLSKIAIGANPGAIIFFILNQYEEQDVSSEIIVVGSAATRQTDSSTIPLAAGLLSTEGLITAKTKPYVGSITNVTRSICQLGSGVGSAVDLYMGRVGLLYYYADVGIGASSSNLNAGMTTISSGFELTALQYQNSGPSYYARRTLPATATVSAPGSTFIGTPFGARFVGTNLRGKIQRLGWYSGIYAQSETQDFLNNQS